MALAPGTRLDSYEILSLIGAGGMGEVYRARDTRLEREVAVKVLPVGTSADPDRLKRFAQEARAVRASRDLARLDLTSGRRDPIATFGPADGAGVSLVSTPVVSADGKTYAYHYQQILSDLFLATGLK